MNEENEKQLNDLKTTYKCEQREYTELSEAIHDIKEKSPVRPVEIICLLSSHLQQHKCFKLLEKYATGRFRIFKTEMIIERHDYRNIFNQADQLLNRSKKN